MKTSTNRDYSSKFKWPRLTVSKLVGKSKPGRGSIFLKQKEDISVVIGIVNDMVANGEIDRSYTPGLTFETTVSGKGKIVGGTGEFHRIKGTMIEVDTLNYLNLMTGELDGAVELTIRYKNHPHHK